MLAPRQWLTDGCVTLGLCVALVCVFALDQRVVRRELAAETHPSLLQTETATKAEPAVKSSSAEKKLPQNRERDSQESLPQSTVSPPPQLEIATRPPLPEMNTTPLEIPTIDQPPTIYSARTEPKRTEIATLRGGSPASEEAVARGLNWLARHQAEDGSWRNNNLGAKPTSLCDKDDVCGDPGMSAFRAQTGLALLAFQAGGHYHNNEHEYSSVVRRGLDWLVASQGADGKLAGRLELPEELNVVGFEDLLPEAFSAHFMYEHGIATLALAEACAVDVVEGREPDAKYLEATKKAVTFMVKNQNNDGGWRYTTNPTEQSDTSVTGWQILALKTALSAGIEVDSDCQDRLHGFMESCAQPDGKTTYQKRSHSSAATTGVGMIYRQFLLNDDHAALIQKAAPYLANQAELLGDSWRARPDYYGWYNCTLAMFRVGGENWERWNNVIREQLVQRQKDDGCERGSWDPNDAWGMVGGRIYSTSLAILTLEVYYRFDKNAETVVHRPPQAGREPGRSRPRSRIDITLEERAQAKLRLADRFFELNQESTGIRWLSDLIRDFPDTEAAAQAREKLEELGDPVTPADAPDDSPTADVREE